MKRSHKDPGILERAAGESLFARCAINCFLAELYYFPYFVAGSFPERVAIERHLNSVLNLDRARSEGLFENYSIHWKRVGRSNYPLVPTKVNFHLKGGTDIWETLPRPLVIEMNRIRKYGLSFPAFLQ